MTTKSSSNPLEICDRSAVLERLIFGEISPKAKEIFTTIGDSVKRKKSHFDTTTIEPGTSDPR